MKAIEGEPDGPAVEWLAYGRVPAVKTLSEGGMVYVPGGAPYVERAHAARAKPARRR